MEEKNITIEQLNPTSFEFQNYVQSDESLIASSDLDTVFSQSTDYIENYVYDENNNLIDSTLPCLLYTIKEGDVLITPTKELENKGYTQGVYNILYNFYRKRLSSDFGFKYYIKEISSDRTEIKLDSNFIIDENIISSTEEFISYRENNNYFVDFYLNFGNNKTVIANNVKLDTTLEDNPTVLIKLYEPLPEEFDIKTELWVIEEISSPQLYKITFPNKIVEIQDFTYISGPNFNLNVKEQTGKSGQLFSYSTLVNSDITSSTQQIQNLLNEKQINININYENYNEFIHFSSAKTRLENFYYKVGLIESASNQLNTYLGQVTSTTSTTSAFSSSVKILTSQIDSVVNNFDGYEYFLYFNSGSSKSYPKQNPEGPPYLLQSTGSTEVLEWLGNATPGSIYYGGQALTASNYDEANDDYLYNAIPEYLREDPDNRKYELFVDMVGQHYDNLWIYTKDISNKFNADNRLEFGISKDLVADAIRDFGIKLYSNNFNTEDLYTAFLGITPTSNKFPFPNITSTLPVSSTGSEYIETKVTSSQSDIIPLNDVNKSLYKRIYHNIPYLLKTKGTIAGLRALITSYGIPDTILRINEFGGKDKNEAQDYDLKQNVFNFAFNTGIDASPHNIITSSFNPSQDFGFGGYSSPSTVQFRFKPAPIPPAVNNLPNSLIRYSQSLWLADDNDNTFSSPGAAVVLEYTGSGFRTGSHSGSIASPFDTWGTLKFYPNAQLNSGITCSVAAPFFNGDWWSAQVTFTGSNATDSTASLFSANEIDGKIGFKGSETKLNLDARDWNRQDLAALNMFANRTINGKIYRPFSGSFQEYRMFMPIISESKFLDYVVNPYSNEGNTINSTPNELMFRAALGSQLTTGSTSQTTFTSIHPKVTGSAVQITQSFTNDSNYHMINFSTNNRQWVPNKENIFQDQVPSGIKNRVTDKIGVRAHILPERPTGSNANIDVLSPYRSIEQDSFVSQSYTPDVNYLEVAISPQNQINDDINAQIGYFNMGDYIGDPRQFSSSARNYPDLDTLRDSYFNKYIKSYDLVDFIRLIKFFDNSLFKMIKDFTPARTSLASGVVVKQHILERNRQRPAQVEFSNVTYTGSVKSQARNYDTGSGDTGQYEFNNGSSIYRFSGGTGGSFERYNGLSTSPSASILGLSNRFNLTQSWSESIDGSVANAINNSGSFQGHGTILLSNQDEFYDGIFSGSSLEVTRQNLNPGCDPYLKPADDGVDYNFLFFSNGYPYDGTVNENAFLDINNYPVSGDAWIYSEYKNITNGIDSQQWVRYIKLSPRDADGRFVLNYFAGIPDLRIEFTEGIVKYIVTDTLLNPNYVLLTIDKFQPDAEFTSSVDGGSENWSLQAHGNFMREGTNTLNSHAKYGFGNAVATETQALKFFNGVLNDELSFFNTGSTYDATDQNWNLPGGRYGVYSPSRTSNIPWLISGSMKYSASAAELNTTASGLYHSGSTFTGHKIAGVFPSVSSIFNPSIQNVPLTNETPQPFQIWQTDFMKHFKRTTFKPSPSIIQLPNGVFDNDLNPLIPGNSGSGVVGLPGGGHSRIIIPGTASLDFHFPYLQFSGSELNLSDEFEIQSVPLSGSARGSNERLLNSDFINTYFPGTTTPNPAAIGGPGFFNFFPIGLFVIPSTTSASLGRIENPLSPVIDGQTPIYSVPLGDLGDSPLSKRVEDGELNQSTHDLASFIYNASVNLPTTSNIPFTAVMMGNPTILSLSASIELSCSAAANITASIEWCHDDSPNNTTVWYRSNNLSGKASAPGHISSSGFLGNIDGSDGEAINEMTETGLSFRAVAWGDGDDHNIEYRLTKFEVSGWETLRGPLFLTLNNGTSQLENFANYENYILTNNSQPFLSQDKYYGIRGTQNSKINQWFIGNRVVEEWPTIDFTAHLKRTGSDGEFLITSSNLLESQSCGPGLSAVFPDSPILDIFHPTVTPSSSINDVGDMYFIEYSGSNPQFPTRVPRIKPNLLLQGPAFDTGSIISAGVGGFLDGYIYQYGNSSISTPSENLTEPGLWLTEFAFFNYASGRSPQQGIGNLFGDVNIMSFGTTSDTGSKIIISQSYSLPSGSNQEMTASLALRNSNDVEQYGNIDANLNQVFISASNQEGELFWEARYGAQYGGFPFEASDNFRLTVDISRSLNMNLSITEYTHSIVPHDSRFSPIPSPFAYNNYNVPSLDTSVVSNFFGINDEAGGNILPFYLALDCQPTLNNYINSRPSAYIMNVSYNNITGSIIPVNFLQILSGSATKASVPDSNYSVARSIIPRYDGSKSTSAQYNIWSPTDKGTFGKLPTIDLRKTYFSYFNQIEDPYPNINDKIKLNVQYLIDEEGNALPPALEGTSRTIFERVYPPKAGGTVAVETSDKLLKALNSNFEISEVGNYYAPIMYSQTGSRNYSNTIPLSGSGRISRYDNNDANSFDSFAFTAIGTASNAPATQQRFFSYKIAPTQDLQLKTGVNTDVYDTSSTGGTIFYTASTSEAPNGFDLNNTQRLTLETQFTTTYIYDTDRTRNEMSVFMSMKSGSLNLPFKVTDVKLSIQKGDGSIQPLGSVIKESWLGFLGKRYSNREYNNYMYHNRYSWPYQERSSFQLKDDKTMQMTLDWEMYHFLRDKGVYVDGGDAQYKNSDFLALIWTIQAENDYVIKSNDKIHWELSGSAKKASAGNQPNAAFFANLFQGEHTPSKITSYGSLDHLLSTDNRSTAPFWVFTGSTSNPSSFQYNNIISQKILVMSSSNMNEAYGTEFYQGNLPYIPGESDIFPTGLEPPGTKFDDIVYPLQLEKGDEIRFANNENYTYTIEEVIKPSDNIEWYAGKKVGRLKIILNKDVPSGVDLNFFLIRRKIPNANSVYLGGTFPYGTNLSASSTPGILYPDFPTELLENSASILVNELISKGIITS